MLGSSSFTGNQINFDNNGKEIEVPDGQNAAIVSLAGCNSDNSNQVAILNNIKNYANFNNCNFNNVSIGLNRDAIIGSRISRLGVDYSSFTNFDGTAIDLFLCNGMKGGIKGNYFTCDYFHDLVHPIISVSYTHFRAHETVLDLVCRLLLELKTHTNIGIVNCRSYRHFSAQVNRP